MSCRHNNSCCVGVVKLRSLGSGSFLEEEDTERSSSVGVVKVEEKQQQHHFNNYDVWNNEEMTTDTAAAAADITTDDTAAMKVASSPPPSPLQVQEEEEEEEKTHSRRGRSGGRSRRHRLLFWKAKNKKSKTAKRLNILSTEASSSPANSTSCSLSSNSVDYDIASADNNNDQNACCDCSEKMIMVNSDNNNNVVVTVTPPTPPMGMVIPPLQPSSSPAAAAAVDAASVVIPPSSSSSSSSPADAVVQRQVPENMDVELTEPDINGQCHPLETPQLIQSKLRDFHYYLSQQKKKQSKWVKMAHEKCENDVINDDFKLLFLRCECFRAKDAAQRYAEYWKTRIEVFGVSHAFRKLILSNLREEDLVAIQSNALQIIHRDGDGNRDLMYLDPMLMTPDLYSRESAVRACWYVLHYLLEDVEVQKKGVVAFFDAQTVDLRTFDYRVVLHVLCHMSGVLPLRISCFLGSHPPRFLKYLTNLFLTVAGEQMRKRIQFHAYDKLVHVVAKKQGIAREHVPQTLGGDLVGMDMKKYIADLSVNGY